MKNSLLIILFFLAGLWQFSAQITTDSLVSKIQLLYNPEVLALRTKLETTFQEVQKENTWKNYDSNFKNEPESAIWLKFEVENDAKDTLPIYYFSIHDFTAIYQEKDNGFKKYKNGNLVPLYNRSNKNEFYVTELKLAPFQKSVIYVRQNSIKKISENRTSALFSKKNYL
jgi:hypothetical protein